MSCWARSIAAGCFIAVATLSLRAETPRPTAPSIGWRSDGTGIFTRTTPPMEWSASPDRNIAWHTTVGASYSSPIIVGDRVFVTAEPDKLVCLSGEDGRILWEKTNNFGDLPAGSKARDPELQSSCGYTTPTPISDGNSVYVVMGTGIVASYDLDGERNWIIYLEVEPTNSYGRSASPRLVDGVLIAPVTVLFGLDARTGKTIWKAPEADSGYGASAVTEVGGAKVLVTPAGWVVRVTDGKVLARDIGSTAYASPIAKGDIVYFVGAPSSAVELLPKGVDRVEARKIWSADLDGEFFASPVLFNGWLYTLNKDGLYDVIDATTGKVVLTGPLQLPPGGQPGEPSGAFAYPSVSLASGRLYVGNTKGDWELLDPAARGDLKAAQIRVNHLPEGSPASPAFAGREMFVRSGAELYCLVSARADERR